MSAKILQMQKCLNTFHRCLKPNFKFLPGNLHARNVCCLTQSNLKRYSRTQETCNTHSRHVSANSCFVLNFTRSFFSFFRRAKPVDEIGYDELKKKIGESKIVLIDVRNPSELEGRGTWVSHYPKAINIPLPELADALSMPKEKFKSLYGASMPDKEASEIVFSCARGSRSYQATSQAKDMGFKNVKSYSGGFEEWRERTGK